MSKKTRENIIIHNYLKKFIILFFVLNFFLVAILTSVFSNTYDLKKYDTRFEKYNIYDRFSREEALNKTQNIILFFSSNSELDKDFFYTRERSHLQDVKILLQNVSYIYYSALFFAWITLIILIFIDKKQYFKNLSNLALFSGIFILGLCLIFLLLFFSSDFLLLFNKFHEVFFTGNYAFDPRISNMKALFPDKFFLDIGLSVLFDLISVGILFTIIGWTIKKTEKKMKKLD